jgi:hypothetical protein
MAILLPIPLDAPITSATFFAMTLGCRSNSKSLLSSTAAAAYIDLNPGGILGARLLITEASPNPFSGAGQRPWSSFKAFDALFKILSTFAE